jgi:hypothetical protein
MNKNEALMELEDLSDSEKEYLRTIHSNEME